MTRCSGFHAAMADVGSEGRLPYTSGSLSTEAHIRGPHLNLPNIAALPVWLLSVGTLLAQAVRSRKRTRPLCRRLLARPRGRG